MVAAEVDEVHALRLQLGDDGGVIRIAGIDAFKHGHGNLGRFQVLLHRAGDALAVRLLVVQHGDLLRLDLADDVLGGGRALLVVAANGAEDELALLGLGQLRRGGRRRDHHDAFVFVDIRCRNRRAGAHVANHEANVLAHDLVGHRHGLLGLAGVVHHHHFELVAAGAASCVDLFDGGQRTGLDHVAILRHRATHRAGNGDLHGFGIGSDANGGQHGGQRDGRKTGQRHQELLDLCLGQPGRNGMTCAIEQHPRTTEIGTAEKRPETRKTGLRKSSRDAGPGMCQSRCGMGTKVRKDNV
ncbi:hypothetical protein D3C72_1463290 [compost metagenome]